MGLEERQDELSLSFIFQTHVASCDWGMDSLWNMHRLGTSASEVSKEFIHI